jgi:predicted metal-dependent peptidase
MNQQLHIRLQQLRSRLILLQPFFGFSALSLELIEDNTQPTMCVNGVWIKYNAEFTEKLSENEAMFVLAHEVCHCLLKHPYRRNGRDWQYWQLACDYAVNAVVDKCGFSLPEGALFDAKFEGCSAEQIYDLLKHQEAQKQQEQNQEDKEDSKDSEDDSQDDGTDGASDDSEGSDSDSEESQEDEGTDGASDDFEGSDSDSEGSQEDEGTDGASDDSEGSEDGSKGSDSDDGTDGASNGSEGSDSDSEGSQGDDGTEGASNTSDSSSQYPDFTGSDLRDYESSEDDQESGQLGTEDAWENIAVQADQVAKMAGKTSVAQSQIVKSSCKPNVDWKDELRRFVSQIKESVGSTWLRPNAMFRHLGLYMPDREKEDKLNLVLVFDTSGSTYLVRDLFISEMNSILSDLNVELRVLYCDTEVYDGGIVDEVSPEFKMLGGGGTSFVPPFDYVENEGIDCDGLIYFTDGWGDFPVKEESYPVLWALTKDWNRPTTGEFILISKYQR